MAASDMIGCLKALKKFVLAGAVFLAVAVRAAGLPQEWLLLTGSSRDRLVDVLLMEERLDELDFLMSVWEGDEWGAEAAARTLVDQAHDPEMTRWLAGYLRRTGRTDEADRLDPPRPRPRSLKAAAPTQSAPEVSSHRPVVFLHGYNGSAETWVDFVRVFGSAGYAKDDMLVFDERGLSPRSRGDSPCASQGQSLCESSSFLWLGCWLLLRRGFRLLTRRCCLGLCHRLRLRYRFCLGRRFGLGHGHPARSALASGKWNGHPARSGRPQRRSVRIVRFVRLALCKRESEV